MGSKPSQNANSSSSMADLVEDNEGGGVIYHLKKKRPGCTGMFWRNDPTQDTKKTLASNDHWPRDNAMLKGQVITTVNGEKWLLASHVKQANDSTWKKAPAGAAMPFEYDNHYYLEAQAP